MCSHLWILPRQKIKNKGGSLILNLVEGSENETAEVTTQAPKVEEDTCADTPGTDCQKYLLYCDNTNTQIPKVCKKSCGHCDKGAVAAATTIATTSQTTPTPTTKAPTTKSSTTIATTMAESECKLEYFYSIFKCY